MRKTILPFIAAFSMLSIFATALYAQTEEYEKGKFISKVTGDTLLYRYLTPENPAKGKKYPLVIFLHGSGERGSDNQAQLFHGSGQFLAIHGAFERIGQRVISCTVR
mgnify:CR=1 FL=1